jgi:hypothetical protein
MTNTQLDLALRGVTTNLRAVSRDIAIAGDAESSIALRGLHARFAAAALIHAIVELSKAEAFEMSTGQLAERQPPSSIHHELANRLGIAAAIIEMTDAPICGEEREELKRSVLDACRLLHELRSQS